MTDEGAKPVHITRHVVYTLSCPQCQHQVSDPVSLEAWKQLPSTITCPQCKTLINLEGGAMKVWTRDGTIDLFRRQLYALHSKELENISKYISKVQIKKKKYTAVFVAYSHDYWLDRVDLHPLAAEIDLVICYRHNSCLSKRVLELSSPLGREYEAFVPPAWFDLEERGGRSWAQVFTGALLAGHGDAYQILEQIREESPAAYYRYLRRKQQLASHKQGHPVAV